MRFSSTYKIIILLFKTLFISILCISQSLYPPKVESPNAASLGKFGEVPVNLNIGSPNISIPLYTLSYGNINVPISLRYNQASVKPAQQPGWVGSGWDLESIGSVSRQVRGLIDENYISDDYSGNDRSYYPYPATSSQANANNFGSYLANLPSTWYTTSQLAYDFFPSDALNIDVEADEFSFNVLGHSGKFYYSGTTKGWEVVSEENIKVEMTSFITPQEVGNAIHDFPLTNGQTWQVPMPYQSRQFGSFTLTVPDGTKFIFGGKNGSVPDAIEFYSAIGNTTVPNYSANPIMTANTWLLKSIVDRFGNQVDFSYTRKYPTCNKFYTATYFSVNVFSGPSCTNIITGGANFDKGKLSGIFQWPMYLSSISSPNGSVRLYMSEHSYNRYTNAQLSYADLNASTYPTSSPNIDNSILGPYWPDMLNNLQWEKLDKIVVYDNLRNSSNGYQANIQKQFQFNYLNTSANQNQRLMLGSLQALDPQNNIISQYQFEYNSDLSTINSPKPIYADGNFTDHWGFYNGLELPLTTSSFDIYKAPQPSVVTIELLKKITYPTGGYTQFTWESNDYSQIVSFDRQSLNSSSGYGGGSRIFEIKHVLTDGSVALDKKYYYKNGYIGGLTQAQINALPSSGVLNGTPVYVFGFYNRLGIYGQMTFSGSSISMSGIGNYGYTGQGSPVGYKEVVEVNSDGSYAKNLFTSYDADLNGISHKDITPLNHLGFDPSQDHYYQYSFLELERGKAIGIFAYKSDNTLLQKTVYTYRNDPQRFVTNPINLIDNTSYYRYNKLLYDAPGSLAPDPIACSVDALVFASARQVYTYSYYPVNITVTTYDQQGNNPLVQSTDLAYNTNNLLIYKYETNSKYETFVTNYAYPNDYASDPTLQAMVAAHILSPIIKETVTKNSTQIRSRTTNYFQPYTGIFVPQNIEVKTGSNPSEISEQVTKYDSKGHIQEIQKPNDVKEVYIWGCNSQYIMAKIVGSDYNTASVLINQSVLDQSGVGNNNYTDAAIRTELNNLRTGLPDALVTTYTYKCGIGLFSETDPNGNTTFFSYDAFGRLATIFDKDNNILKKFCYNYAGQPENCTTTLFSNDQQQATFTKIGCGTGTIAQTYTYTVPAGTYTSYIDKSSANQLAIDAMNTNGQAAANALPCLAPFTATNTTSIPWNVTVTKTDGTFTNTYSLYPNQSNLLLANIPVGTYNLTITYMYSPSNSQLVINGTTYTGTSFNLTNVSITAPTSFTVQPVPGGPCSFSMSSGYSSPTNSISNNNGTVSFYIVFYSSSSMSQGNSYLVATINGGCRPSATRTINNVSAGGRTWTITIYTSGAMYWQMAYGSATLNPNTTISTSTLSYPL